MAAVGRGRGRGRGLLARETSSESSSKPGGLAGGDAKVTENGSEVPVGKSSSPLRKDSLSELSDVLDNLKLDISEQDLKNLQQMTESALREDADVKRLTTIVYEKCISDREFAKTGAYVCEKLASIENTGTQFRSGLLSLVQVDFKKKEELQSSSPSKFLNVFSFMCQVFNIMRTAGGEVFKALVSPLYEYINLIVDNKDCTSDGYECLNIQDEFRCLQHMVDVYSLCLAGASAGSHKSYFPLSKWLSNHEVYLKLQAVGKELELNDKEKMENLMEKFRSKIIRNGSSAQARCTLLELLECYNRGWKELPNEVTRFYLDIMMDIITD